MTLDDAPPLGNVYDKYESRNPVTKWLMRGFMRALDRSLPETNPSAVLEVGVGEGEVSARVAGSFQSAFVIGVDLPSESLAEGWKGRGLRGAFGDAQRLPFRDRSFDLVLAIEVLEHLPDPAGALSEIARVAKGDVVLSVPREPIWRVGNLARAKYVRRFGDTPGHIQHWSRRGFLRLVGGHLRVVAVSTPLPWTMVVATPRQPS
jgi:ubiquinone/menaquinone biosynthesis C-methylase UbiE